MKRSALAILATLLASAYLAAAEPPSAKTHEVRLNGHTFTLPEGFEIELVAGPPLVNRPIVADFDEDGRLYVADSSGSNDPVKVQLEKKPHRIVRLECTKGDGKFDRGHVFADRMMFPEGTMWLNGSLYVAAPPSIWKFTDTNDDESPSFAPNGRLIIYASRAQGRDVLMTTTLDGKIKARLVSTTADVREPVWGPYGR